jgi:TBC1 domain family protein 5
MPLFREPSVQNLMTIILLFWAKLNPDIGYRQGMHELLAIIYIVVERDAVVCNQATDVIQAVFDSRYIEHDSAILFIKLMRAIKPWYEISPEKVNRSEPVSFLN